MGRHAERGDRAPALDAKAIERFEVGQEMDSAQGELANAVREVLSGAGPDDLQAVADWLGAVARGTSTDDLVSLHNALI